MKITQRERALAKSVIKKAIHHCGGIYKDSPSGINAAWMLTAYKLARVVLRLAK